jgi:hypothetical protein
MNKITYFTIAIILMLSPASALEKKDCSGIKKLSKAFIACKSGNLKAGIINTGSSIKKGTVGKIKKEKKINNENDSSTATKIVNATKDKASNVKSSVDGLFKGTTKQYPKYSKSKEE